MSSNVIISKKGKELLSDSNLAFNVSKAIVASQSQTDNTANEPVEVKVGNKTIKLRSVSSARSPKK